MNDERCMLCAAWAAGANGLCSGCSRKMDGVTLVPNSATDAQLISSLREHVRTLTAERDATTKRLDDVGAPTVDETPGGPSRRSTDRISALVLEHKRREDALRARVAELEEENERLARHHAERVAERDAAQQRAKALEQQVAELTRPQPPPHPIGCDCTECYERAMRYIENGNR